MIFLHRRLVALYIMFNTTLILCSSYYYDISLWIAFMKYHWWLSGLSSEELKHARFAFEVWKQEVYLEIEKASK